MAQDRLHISGALDADHIGWNRRRNLVLTGTIFGSPSRWRNIVASQILWSHRRRTGHNRA